MGVFDLKTHEMTDGDFDGKHVLYDVGEDINQIPDFKDLVAIQGLWKQFSLDESRTCVYWNDRIDLPSDSIYEYGKVI